MQYKRNVKKFQIRKKVSKAKRLDFQALIFRKINGEPKKQSGFRQTVLYFPSCYSTGAVVPDGVVGAVSVAVVSVSVEVPVSVPVSVV
jgi:hypothetical protein